MSGNALLKLILVILWIVLVVLDYIIVKGMKKLYKQFEELMQLYAFKQQQMHKDKAEDK
ncbi:hypothetical protein GWP40_08575 [Treponema vincentii]|uniref:hypothetical protein n=1 Tax=Treponema vincentii TaxID=69710 RepID=UPI001BAFB916|nr:hypothetical protein [Treponema vincentii]QUY18362.1 hypothetical protein GWP40_08575 [Treponema vincentii]